MNPNIFILSAPIRSGKTTALMEFWEMGHLSFDGFIAPEIDEKRKLIFLDSEEEIPFEVEDNSMEDYTEIGPFKFYNSAFEKVRNEIKNLSSSVCKLIVIDEIGYLELEGNGYEPELSEYINYFKEKTDSQILMLVVRNSLLNKVIEKYELDDAQVLSLDLFKSMFLQS